VYADSADHSIDLNNASIKFDSQPDERDRKENIWPEVGDPLDSGIRLLMCLSCGQICAGP
jgi:hypothetical protein